MQNQDQPMQSNTHSKGTICSQDDHCVQPNDRAKMQQQPKRSKSLENDPLTPSHQQKLPACLLQAVSNIAIALQLEEAELALWLEEYSCLSPRVLLHFLHQIRKYRLGPLSLSLIHI